MEAAARVATGHATCASKHPIVTCADDVVIAHWTLLTNDVENTAERLGRRALTKGTWSDISTTSFARV